ncbi:ribonuclease Z [Aegicerativicinus sediminis]|uniref:ribonuclease Z n=1 Tax=Aegicerativicinus sediminis TaxID=2893202 RepID=UPI001E35515D|nr:ribonuclease Z [Aegicerativicinus sediminis]
MNLTILGCHSATPRVDTNPTAQILEIRNHNFLIDCGEGTQVQLRNNRIKFSRIKHIFISHLHGDHYFGLIGLLSTFQLLGRQQELHIYGPKGLREIIELQLKLSNSYSTFDLVFHELTSVNSEIILDDEQVTVRTIPLNHRIYTNGFLFSEKPGERILLPEEAKKAKVDVAYYRKLKQGFDVINEDGILVKNDEVTLASKSPKSYAYCSDTFFDESIVPIIKNSTVLYHESTFLDKHERLAEPTGHSTAKHAAYIAKMADVRLLILGHFSTRYDDLNLFREEAETIFRPIELAADGKKFTFE